MNKRNNHIIVIEGTDGSGKTEQSNLLVKKLKSRGIEVALFDFPRYEEESSYFVRQYLNGLYGSVDEVSPKQASLFYALDRFGAKVGIQEAQEENKVVIINRYVASNMAHQGAKIAARPERLEYYRWIGKLEFSILGIPRPSLNIILHMPAELAQRLVDKKSKRDYINNGARDIHEDDINHLQKAELAYKELAVEFPQFFELLECSDGKAVKSIDAIHDELWLRVAKKLGIEP